MGPMYRTAALSSLALALGCGPSNYVDGSVAGFSIDEVRSSVFTGDAEQLILFMSTGADLCEQGLEKHTKDAVSLFTIQLENIGQLHGRTYSGAYEPDNPRRPFAVSLRSFPEGTVTSPAVFPLSATISVGDFEPSAGGSARGTFEVLMGGADEETTQEISGQFDAGFCAVESLYRPT